MARPAKAREQLLDAAENLLLARGYGAAQLDRICEEAGVSKGAIFYHFPTKEALAEATVERFFERLVKEGATLAAAAGTTTAVARLFGYVDAVAALTRTPALTRGCLLGVVTMECTETSPELAATAGRALVRWEHALTDLIQDAAAERGLDLDATGLAKALLAAVEGGLLLDRQGGAPRAVDAAVAHFRSYLSLVLAEKETPR
jgi:TetR/AcrR family transcriptional regulator, transcriptional repressor for nem operon